MSDELTDKQSEVIDVLLEGRATPALIRKQTSLPSKHAVNDHLTKLRAKSVVQKVDRGLYELDPSSQFAEPRLTEEEFEFSPTRAGDSDE